MNITNDKIATAARESLRAIVHEFPVREDWAKLVATVEATMRSILLSGSAAEDDSKPGEDDVRYEVLSAAGVDEHFSDLPVLEASRIVAGRSYYLSPGQRAWLRETYSMTPTETVTLIDLALWKGTKHPKQMILRSDEHIDPRRRHVLSKCVISSPGRFFRESAERDVELRDSKPQRATVLKVLQKGIVTIALADKRELSAVTTLVLKEGADVIARWHSDYDPKTKVNTECWKVVKLLDYIAPGDSKAIVKRPKLQDLAELLKELEGVV